MYPCLIQLKSCVVCVWWLMMNCMMNRFFISCHFKAFWVIICLVIYLIIADVSGQVREVELIHADALEIVFSSAAFIQPQSQNVLAESSVRMSSWTKLQLISFLFLCFMIRGFEKMDPVCEEWKFTFWGQF